jgi:galacturonosyltransferase
MDEYEVVISSPYDLKSDYYSKKGIKIINVQIRRHGVNPFSDLKLFFDYLKIVKKIKPNIILTYTIKPNIYGGIVARFTKIPYLPNITGLGTSFEKKGILRIITIKLYKIALKKAHTIFFQNKDNMELMCTKGIKGKNHILLPGSGVNIEHFSYLEYPNSDTIHFLFIGRVMQAKGIDYYLKAAKYIKFRYSNIVFHILGSCEEDYKKMLDEYESQGIIKYHGRVDDIREFLRIVHAIVHPTFHEGMSNVLLEAASSGRPVLASIIPGCKETFDEGVSGYGFIAKNQTSLNNAIEKFILLDSQEKKNMGIRGREKVKCQFNRFEVVKTYVKVIQSILEEK